ncbi:hypothetical protein [uncultured Corynebacterium sp.]|uniref:hypothetical protein n=1 Tax=uncultured Corynebacterium sp. TaxID=159447 RepID=UPI00262CE676|nr:hypothetical protein [uncultured Corynebacterium sp.]
MILQTMLDRIEKQEADDDLVYEVRVWTANRYYADKIKGTRTALDTYYGALELVFGDYSPDDPTYLVLGGPAVRFQDIEAIELKEAQPGDQ